MSSEISGTSSPKWRGVGDADRRRAGGPRVQPGGVDRVAVPGVADELSGQKFPDHVHRFLEHFHALFRRRPLITQDVLVEHLAGAHAKAEPASGQPRRRGSRLGETAGCTRPSGHVTAVVTGNDVACEIAPMTDQTKPLSPCSSSHGWK